MNLYQSKFMEKQLEFFQKSDLMTKFFNKNAGGTGAGAASGTEPPATDNIEFMKLLIGSACEGDSRTMRLGFEPKRSKNKRGSRKKKRHKKKRRKNQRARGHSDDSSSCSSSSGSSSSSSGYSSRDDDSEAEQKSKKKKRKRNEKDSNVRKVD